MKPNSSTYLHASARFCPNAQGEVKHDDPLLGASRPIEMLVATYAGV